MADVDIPRSWSLSLQVLTQVTESNRHAELLTGPAVGG